MELSSQADAAPREWMRGLIGLKKKGEESEEVKEEIVNEALERIKCTRQTSL